MINVAVLYGGTNNEANVSLETGSSIINSLDKSKYNIIELIVKDDKTWILPLINENIDIAILALHGDIGENGSIQGLLECLHIPYIGAGVLGSAIGMNKYISKQLLEYNGLTTPKCIFLNHNEHLDVKKLSDFNFPVVVKPNDDGSSYGTSLVYTKDELVESIAKLLSKNTDILIEEYIEGTEVTVGVIEEKNSLNALKVLEIIPENSFYDYEAKYESEATSIHEANLNEDILYLIKENAKKAFKILNARSYARIDMIIKNNIPYILEINTLPGMTSHSLIPKSLDISIGEFFDKQIANTLK